MPSYTLELYLVVLEPLIYSTVLHVGLSGECFYSYRLCMLQAIKQMYVLVLGLDVLGNPFGVLCGLATGIEDLFYEPYHGAIQGPEEFAEGLANGLRSLLGHAVGKASFVRH